MKAGRMNFSSFILQDFILFFPLDVAYGPRF
jgi:hypothetical protein